MPTDPAAELGRIGELKRFTLWETRTHFYLVAYNTAQTRYRVLKVDRSIPQPSHPPPPPTRSASPEPHEASHGPDDPSVAAAVSSVAPAPSGAPSFAVTAAGTTSAKQTALSLLSGATPMASREAADSASMSTTLAACPPSALTSSLSAANPAPSTATNATATPAPPAAPSADEATRGPNFSLSASGEPYLDANTAERAAAPLYYAASDEPAGAGDVGSVVGAQAQAPGHPPGIPSSHLPNSSHLHPHHRHLSQDVHEGPESLPPPSAGEASTPAWQLNIVADKVVYTRSQIDMLLAALREGNKASGGLTDLGRFYGIVGFVRFTLGYYMVLITRRSVVALVGGHYIYHCDDTVVLPVSDPAHLASLPGKSKARDQAEARFLATFRQVDLAKNFYFSYTYDLTNTLQNNLTAPPPCDNSDSSAAPPDGYTATQARYQPLTAWGFNEKFVWNHHLLMPAFGSSVHHAHPVAAAGWSMTSESGQDDPTPAGSEWVLPLVYGFVDQAKLSVLSRTVYVTLIARRSRHFAGARFLKRGVTENGQVANDVETEQIVTEPLTTPFFVPAQDRTCGTPTAVAGRPVARGRLREAEESGTYTQGRWAPSPRFTSYVMHRGSIPVYWTQDSTNMSPRPPIEMSVVDPYYSAAALHFDDLFRRYGAPVIVLNLIKAREKQPRESKLLWAFTECIKYLDQFLPPGALKYIAWDMSRASKSHDQDVIGVLEDIAEETLDATQFFHSGPPASSRSPALVNPGSPGGATATAAAAEAAAARGATHGQPAWIQLQSGVVRVNCVDCLDRTNAAQFMIGKAALAHQLRALGLLAAPSLPFDCDAVNMLTEMYHDLGDTIALQYGGSHLVNTVATYRKINAWSSHSRDMLEGLKRYYANSFIDAEKQAAINLFLGVDDAPGPGTFSACALAGKSVPVPSEVDGSMQTGPGLSSATSSVPTCLPSATGGSARRTWAKQQRWSVLERVNHPRYRDWYVPAHIKSLQTTAERASRQERLATVVAADQSGFWTGYYRPRLFTDLARHHAFKMTEMPQALPPPGAPEPLTVPSPFVQPRRGTDGIVARRAVHARKPPLPAHVTDAHTRDRPRRRREGHWMGRRRKPLSALAEGEDVLPDAPLERQEEFKDDEWAHAALNSVAVLEAACGRPAQTTSGKRSRTHYARYAASVSAPLLSSTIARGKPAPLAGTKVPSADADLYAHMVEFACAPPQQSPPPPPPPPPQAPPPQQQPRRAAPAPIQALMPSHLKAEENAGENDWLAPSALAYADMLPGAKAIRDGLDPTEDKLRAYTLWAQGPT